MMKTSWGEKPRYHPNSQAEACNLVGSVTGAPVALLPLRAFTLGRHGEFNLFERDEFSVGGPSSLTFDAADLLLRPMALSKCDYFYFSKVRCNCQSFAYSICL